jgi:hypothetical protein
MFGFRSHSHNGHLSHIAKSGIQVTVVYIFQINRVNSNCNASQLVHQRTKKVNAGRSIVNTTRYRRLEGVRISRCICPLQIWLGNNTSPKSRTVCQGRLGGHVCGWNQRSSVYPLKMVTVLGAVRSALITLT